MLMYKHLQLINLRITLDSGEVMFKKICGPHSC